MTEPHAKVLFEHCHPAAGSVTIARREEEVLVECHWPFDDSTNDWIHIATSVTLESVERCARALAAGDSARAAGVSGGFIEFAPRIEGGVTLEIADWMEPAPRRLALHIPETSQMVATRLSVRS